MNEIRMYLKTSGSIAELYKDFNLFKGSYQNVLLSIYVPKSLLYENQEGTFSNVVKTGAILTSQNGTKITTKSYYADYVKDIEINGIAYSVYSQHLPHEYVVYAGTQTVIANVVALDITDPNTPVVLQITTSQTAQLVIQESAYLADDDIIDPTDLEKINAQLDELQKNKLDKQTGVPSYPQVYAVEGDTQKLIPVSNGSTIAPNDRIAQYTSRGTLFTQPPEADSDTTNKGYVDNAIQEAVADKEHFRGYLSTEEIKALKNPTEGDYAWSSDTRTVWSYNGTEWIDTQVPVPDQTVPKGTSIPLPDAATGSAGKATSYAAIDHIHPPSSEYPSKEEFDVSLITYTKNGAAVGEVDTLAGAKAEVSVESKNLFDLNADKYWGSADITERTGSTFTVSGQAGTWVAAEFILPEIQNKTLTVSGEWITSGSNVGGLRVQWITQNGIAVGNTIAETYISGQAATGTVPKKPDNAKYLGFFVYSNTDGTVTGSTSVTYENVQIEIGESATAYTPYLSEGTEVEMNACGENLANENTLITSNEYERAYFQGRECLKFKGTGYKPFTLNFPEKLNIVGINWALDSDTPNKEISFLRLVYTNFSDESKTTYVGQGNVDINNWVDAAKTASPTLFENIKSLKIDNTENLGTGTFYVQIMANLGDELTPYTPYIGAAYQSEVGQTIEVEQYDRITNIFTNTAGAAVAVQFKISTQLYLDRFGLIEEGLFANRPTDISEQSRVYIATDRFDNSRYTYLKGGVDGSVTENWTEIVNYGQDNLQTKSKELVPAINEVNAAAGTALLNIPKSAEETGAFISGNNTLAGAKAEVEVGSENLIPFPYARSGGTQNGVTWTVADDGTITATGTATGSSGLVIFFASETAPIPVNGQYTLSLNKQGEGANAVFAELEKDGAYQGGYYNDTTFSYQNNYITVIRILASAGYTYNCTIKPKFQIGAVVTPYTPYLPTGTAVEVQACGKNLFDENGVTSSESAVFTELTAEQIKVSAIIEIPSGNAGYAGVAQKNIKAGQTVTINASWTTSASANKGRIAAYWKNANILIGQQLYSNTPLTVTIPNSTNENDVVYFYFYVATGGGSAAVGDEVTYTNITINLGDKDLGFSTPVSATYQSAIGETIEVEQYDGVTNIFSNTAGAAVSTQFLQSTRYELDTKPVSLAGNYAERPTETYPYVVLYTANDAGRTYRLERDTDGSVSSNWVNISSAGGTGGGFTPRGEWNSTTTYNENDLVSLNGSSYICIEENTNATPASNPDKWMVNAEKGATGATGATGTTGPAGTDGHSVYTATDTCSAEVGVECEVYKDSTNAKGVGDVIINASGRVFTVTGEDVHEGKPTWAGPVTAIINGPQGPAGANGTNGKDYLIYKDIPLNNGTMPSPTNYVNLDLNEFSRTPIIDENFTIVYRYGSNSVGIRNYYCVMRVVSISGTSVRCAFDDYVQLSRNIYEHHVTYTVSGTLVACFTVINTYKSAFATTGDLTSYMYPNCPYPVTGWYRESSSNVGWGLNLIITTGGSINFKFASATGEISYTADNDELVTDVVVKML